MKFFRKNRVIKVVWLLLAVHILNCSIDPPDVLPESTPEDLTVNEIESMAELLAEDILGIENAVSEEDEHDSEDGTSLDSKKVCSFCNKKAFSYCAISYIVNVNNLSTPVPNFYSYQYSEVLNPPPEA